MIADEFMVDFCVLADECERFKQYRNVHLSALHALDPPSSYLDDFLMFSCIYIMKNVTQQKLYDLKLLPLKLLPWNVE